VCVEVAMYFISLSTSILTQWIELLSSNAFLSRKKSLLKKQPKQLMTFMKLCNHRYVLLATNFLLSRSNSSYGGIMEKTGGFGLSAAGFVY